MIDKEKMDEIGRRVVKGMVMRALFGEWAFWLSLLAEVVKDGRRGEGKEDFGGIDEGSV